MNEKETTTLWDSLKEVKLKMRYFFFEDAYVSKWWLKRIKEKEKSGTLTDQDKMIQMPSIVFEEELKKGNLKVINPLRKGKEED